MYAYSLQLQCCLTKHFRKFLSRCPAAEFPLFAGDLDAKGHCIVYNAIPVTSILSQQIWTQKNGNSRVKWEIS